MTKGVNTKKDAPKKEFCEESDFFEKKKNLNCDGLYAFDEKSATLLEKTEGLTFREIFIAVTLFIIFAFGYFAVIYSVFIIESVGMKIFVAVFCLAILGLLTFVCVLLFFKPLIKKVKKLRRRCSALKEGKISFGQLLELRHDYLTGNGKAFYRIKAKILYEDESLKIHTKFIENELPNLPQLNIGQLVPVCIFEECVIFLASCDFSDADGKKANAAVLADANIPKSENAASNKVEKALLADAEQNGFYRVPKDKSAVFLFNSSRRDKMYLIAYILSLLSILPMALFASSFLLRYNGKTQLTLSVLFASLTWLGFIIVFCAMLKNQIPPRKRAAKIKQMAISGYIAPGMIDAVKTELYRVSDRSFRKCYISFKYITKAKEIKQGNYYFNDYRALTDGYAEGERLTVLVCGEAAECVEIV